MIYERVRAMREKQTHLPQHLRSRVHVLSTTPQSGMVDREIDDFADYAKVYGAYVWLKKAVTVITNAIAPLPVIVVDRDKKEISSPISDVYGTVNDTMTPVDLWSLWGVHMLLGGESFFQYVLDGRGRPVEVWPRRPDFIGIKPDIERGVYFPAVAQYVFDPTRGGAEVDPLDIPPEEMTHFRFPNPTNPYRGLSPARAIRTGITIDIFAQAWEKAFYKNGARPDWALIAPQGLTPTERDGYYEKIMQRHSGVENAYLPIVLEDGITDVKVVGYAPKDLEWMEHRKMSRDEVGAVYGVPDGIMGWGQESYDTATKMDGDLEYLWTLTILPLIQRRDSTLTAFWRRQGLIGADQTIETDLSSVGILQDDLTPKFELAKTGFEMGVPFNVLDEKLHLGIGPIPGGDVGYISFNRIAVSDALADAVTSETDQSAEDSEPDDAEKAVHKAANFVPEYGSPRHKSLWKRATALYAPHARKMKAQLLVDFTKQQDEVLESVRTGELPQKASGEDVDFERNDYPTNADDIFDMERWVAYFTLAYEALYTDAVRASGQALFTEFDLDEPFDVGSKLVQDAIFSMRVKFAKDINEVTQSRIGAALREVLAEADEAGDWTVERVQSEIYDSISNVFDVRKSSYERERIARTEMHKASELGTIEGARQTGLDLVKGWLAALDGRERDTHREAHIRYRENPIGLDDQFEVGRDNMTAPGLGTVPEENINCRCTSLYATAEGFEEI